MPVSHSIDRQRRLITIVVAGDLDDSAFDMIERDIASDPAYDRGYDCLIDARAARKLIGSLGGLRGMAAKQSVDPGVRRAIVTESLLFYGLARVFQAVHDARGLPDEVAVFRDIDAAAAWLAQPRAALSRGA